MRDLPTPRRHGRDAAGDRDGRSCSPTRSRRARSCAPGSGMVDGFLRLVPEARVGHLGMYRDEEDRCARSATTSACRPGSPSREVFVARPDARDRRQRRPRARAGSSEAGARAAAARLPGRPRPRASRRVHAAHPDVPIWTAALDRELDDNGYIRPGPGRRGRPRLRHLGLEPSVCMVARPCRRTPRPSSSRPCAASSTRCPALKPMTLVVGVDLHGRGDTQQFRVELPEVAVRKDIAADARVRARDAPRLLQPDGRARREGGRLARGVRRTGRRRRPASIST